MSYLCRLAKSQGRRCWVANCYYCKGHDET